MKEFSEAKMLAAAFPSCLLVCGSCVHVCVFFFFVLLFACVVFQICIFLFLLASPYVLRYRWFLPFGVGLFFFFLFFFCFPSFFVFSSHIHGASLLTCTARLFSLATVATPLCKKKKINVKFFFFFLLSFLLFVLLFFFFSVLSPSCVLLPFFFFFFNYIDYFFRLFFLRLCFEV